MNPAEETELTHLYRFEAMHYESDGMMSPGLLDKFKSELILEKHPISAETPKGYWISLYCGNHKDRWVSKTAKKRFAYPTVKEAFDSYLARKLSYVKHARRQLARAEADLHLAYRGVVDSPKGIKIA